MNWEEFIPWLRWNRVAPLFYFRVNEAGLTEKIPGFAYNKLNEYWKLSEQRYLQFLETFKLVSSHLTGAGIPFQVLKGMALSHITYPNPACKPMADIDLLFHPDDLEKANDILLKAGLKRKTGSENRFMEDLRHHLPPLFYKNSMIELHRNFLTPSEKGNLSADDIWKNTMESNVFGQSYKMPDIVLNYFMLNYHIFSHKQLGYVRLIWLLDLYLFHRKFQDQIVQDQFVSLVRNSGVDEEILSLPDRIVSLFEKAETDDPLLGWTIPSVPSEKSRVFRYLINLDNNLKLKYIGGKLWPRKSYLLHRFEASKNTMYISLLLKLYKLYLKKTWRLVFKAGVK